MRKKLNIESAIFFLIFLILGFFASKTFLFSDDLVIGFTAVTNDYFNYYKNFLHDWGLYRPFALVYYFFIYEIFFNFPWLSHLIPLVIHISSGYLLFKTLIRQGLNKFEAFIPSILLITVPFAVEPISWLSANTGIIVIFIFFGQVYLIERDNGSKNLLLIILILQTIATFIYETTILMPLSLAYLLYIKSKEKSIFKLTIFSIFPIIMYVFSKLVLKPEFTHKDKFITVPEIINNWISSSNQLRMILLPKFFNDFWLKELINGINLIATNTYLILLFSILILLLFIKLFKKDQPIEVLEPKTKTPPYFWLISFCLTLVPLSWQPYYFPFRTLLLPFIVLVILVIFIFKKIKSNLKIFGLNFVLKLIFIILISIFILIDVSMIDQYAAQYKFDKKITLEINNKLKEFGFENTNRSNLYLKKFSDNNIDRLVYGDYIHSLYYDYWSAEALLDLNSGSFAKVAIEIPSDNTFSAKISKAEFLKLRPLTIMSFTDNKSCIEGECLKVEAVYQKPY